MITPYTFIELLIWRGAQPKNVDAQMIVAYFANLMARNRIFAMYKDGALDGFATFFILESSEALPSVTDKPMWATPPDHADGTLVFFDKLVSNRWNLEARRTLQAVLLERFPQLTHACWLRPRVGRPTMTVYRRPGYATHL